MKVLQPLMYTWWSKVCSLKIIKMNQPLVLILGSIFNVFVQVANVGSGLEQSQLGQAISYDYVSPILGNNHGKDTD